MFLHGRVDNVNVMWSYLFLVDRRWVHGAELIAWLTLFCRERLHDWHFAGRDCMTDTVLQGEIAWLTLFCRRLHDWCCFARRLHDVVLQGEIAWLTVTLFCRERLHDWHCFAGWQFCREIAGDCLTDAVLQGNCITDVVLQGEIAWLMLFCREIAWHFAGREIGWLTLFCKEIA